jgi:tetratricopeptide (TPR) repeat protein
MTFAPYRRAVTKKSRTMSNLPSICATACLLLAWAGPTVYGQTSAPPAAPVAEAALTSRVEWVDAIWADHLVARAGVVTNQPLLVEAFYRDALRVNPDATNSIEKFARFYQGKKIKPMDRAMAELGRRLAPSLAVWDEISGNAKMPAASELTAAEKEIYQQGSAQFQAGQFMQAELQLRRLLARHPEHQALLTDLGLLYTQTADWTMSAAVFSYLVHLYPDDFNAANNLSVSFDRIGRPDLVYQVLLEQMKDRADDPYLVRNLAVYAAKSGKTIEALNYGKIWAGIAPESPDALNFYGRQLLASGHLIEAMQIAEASLAVAPEQAETIAFTAETLIAAGKMDEAMARLKKLATVIRPEEFGELIHREPYRRVPGIGDLATGKITEQERP